MADPMPLFTPAELGDHLGKTSVNTARALSAERMAWGWLQPILGGSKPDPAPDHVWAWAVELGAIAYENPAGLASYQLGAETKAFSAERRAAILAEAASATTGAGGTSAGGPRGSFPPAQAWPDPIRSTYRTYC